MKIYLDKVVANPAHVRGRKDPFPIEHACPIGTIVFVFADHPCVCIEMSRPVAVANFDCSPRVTGKLFSSAASRAAPAISSLGIPLKCGSPVRRRQNALLDPPGRIEFTG
jgi:hypothetical protein